MIHRYGLYRDPARGWVAGVAAGLAERFGVSAGVIRLCFLLMAFMGTPILAGVLYAVLAVLMPARPLLIDDRPYRGDYWRREY
jgi:phage shock protein PspC (stress-responsive transcriptional regulator)